MTSNESSDKGAASGLSPEKREDIWALLIAAGVLLCVVFAFVVMNIDHMLHKYHKADIASTKIPDLKRRLALATAAGRTKPGIIILGVHYIWSDVLQVGGTGILLPRCSSSVPPSS